MAAAGCAVATSGAVDTSVAIATTAAATAAVDTPTTSVAVATPAAATAAVVTPPAARCPPPAARRPLPPPQGQRINEVLLTSSLDVRAVGINRQKL